MMQKSKQRSTCRKSKDGRESAVVTLGFDITTNVKYESMRNQARRGHLYRQHKDLERECDRQIRSYEMGEKLLVLEFKLYKKKLETRLSQLQSKSETNSKMTYSYNQWNSKQQSSRQPIKQNLVNNSLNPAPTKQGRTTLLFSVMHRDGEDIYIENPNDRFINLGPPKALGKSHDDSQIGLRRAEVPRPPPQLVRELTM